MTTKILSLEDRDLNRRPIIGSTFVNYRDIDLSFIAKQTGDIYKKTDAAAVKQSVKNILLTTPGEKPFSPYFGGSLNSLLFELATDDLDDDLEEQIKYSIENFEPRAKVQNVDVIILSDINTARVKITFQIVSTEEIVVFETSINRIR